MFIRRSQWGTSLAAIPLMIRNIKAEYLATRVAFRRDVIDPLADDDAFRIMTPEGHFEMTKREFMTSFPNVIASASYREKGTYHYPRVPSAAERFRVQTTAQGKTGDS